MLHKVKEIILNQLLHCGNTDSHTQKTNHLHLKQKTKAKVNKCCQLQ